VLQVQSCGLQNASDLKIWEFAANQGYTIVTFDADFFELANLKGHPPKIIWLRCGNQTTDYLAWLINSKAQIIKDFIQHPEYANLACLEMQ
jgi:predicted nuclease of predicted toxin-antitoxin system